MENKLKIEIYKGKKDALTTSIPFLFYGEFIIF